MVTILYANKKAEPRSLIAKVALVCFLVGTTLATVGILRGHLSPLSMKVLVTSYAASFYLLLFAACMGAKGQLVRMAARVGMAGAAVAFTLGMGMMWLETGTDFLLRLFGGGTVVALAAAHSSLLSRARVGADRDFITIMTQVCVWAICTQHLSLIFFEWQPGTFFLRLLSVAWLIKWTGTLTVAALHMLTRVDDDPSPPSPSGDSETV